MLISVYFVVYGQDGILLTIYLLERSDDNLCKQFGPSSGLTFCWDCLTLMVFLKELFKEVVILKKKSTDQQKEHAKLPSMQMVKLDWCHEYDRLRKKNKTKDNKNA